MTDQSEAGDAVSKDTLRHELESASVVPISEGVSDGKQGNDGASREAVQRDANTYDPGGDIRNPDGRPHGQIFEGCPVKPLGVYGDVSYYLDTRGQLRGVDNHTLQKMLHVFGGRAGYLSSKFPAEKGGYGKFNQLQLSAAMISAAEERGMWSPVGKVRGAGAWTDDDGGLIYHAGDQVMIDGEWHPPGEYEGRVYPAADPVPRPADETGSAGAEILEMSYTWRWGNPSIDPMLAFGSICAQILGGALEWRPVTWLSGDRATGKSTFQRMVRYLHGGSAGLLQTSDATEAGIRSIIGFSSLPVAVDEAEQDDDQQRAKTKAVVKLARIAASGDQVLRGSTDQKGFQSHAYSCFFFSSITLPPMPAQDRSRLILLNLDELDGTEPKPKDDPRRLRRLGAQLRRQLFDGWPTFREREDIWRAALAKAGHGGRVADNYGTLMALADMGLHSSLPDDEETARWVAMLEPRIQAEKGEIGSNAEDMLIHLLSQPLDVWRRGRKYNVASWVAMAAKLDNAPTEIDVANSENANSYLAPFGLRVLGKGDDARLALANKALQPLAALFHGSPWAEGGWAQAARRINGAQAKNMTFARVPSRAYVVPFQSIPGLLNAMEQVPGDGSSGAYIERGGAG